mgnify:FL=1
MTRPPRVTSGLGRTATHAWLPCTFGTGILLIADVPRGWQFLSGVAWALLTLVAYVRCQRIAWDDGYAAGFQARPLPDRSRAEHEAET